MKAFLYSPLFRTRLHTQIKPTTRTPAAAFGPQGGHTDLSPSPLRGWAAGGAAGWEVLIAKFELQLLSKPGDASPGLPGCVGTAGTGTDSAGAAQLVRASRAETHSKTLLLGQEYKGKRGIPNSPHSTPNPFPLMAAVSELSLPLTTEASRPTTTLPVEHHDEQRMLSWHDLYYCIFTITLESYKHLLFSPFVGYSLTSLPCSLCKATPSSVPHPPAPAGQGATAAWISTKGQSSPVYEAKPNRLRKTLLQEQEEDDPKAVLHFYRFIWVLQPSPKTGRTQKGNYFLLIKRMKRPNIDFVLHHHTKKPSNYGDDDGMDYHTTVNQSEGIY